MTRIDARPMQKDDGLWIIEKYPQAKEVWSNDDRWSDYSNARNFPSQESALRYIEANRIALWHGDESESD